MPSIVDRHQQALTRRVLATFADAWADTDGTVAGTEALLAQALRASPQDEGLLRLRAWSLSWGPLRTSPTLPAHHLHRWMDLAGSVAGRFALERLRTDEPEAHGTPLLLNVLPVLPAAAVPGVRTHLPGPSPAWLPMQALLLDLPLRPPQRPVRRNAWTSTAALWPQVSAQDLAGWTWLNAHGAPDLQQLGRAAWWLTLVVPDGDAQRQVMRAYRHAVDRVAPTGERSPGPSGPCRNDALKLGLHTAHDHGALNRTPGSIDAWPVWCREATQWLQQGARLPHHDRFDLPPALTLPWQGSGFPESGTYDDAVACVRQSSQRATIERDVWFTLWEVLLPVEARCVEREQLQGAAQAALDEQGLTTEQLKTRPRL